MWDEACKKEVEDGAGQGIVDGGKSGGDMWHHPWRQPIPKLVKCIPTLEEVTLWIETGCRKPAIYREILVIWVQVVILKITK